MKRTTAALFASALALAAAPALAQPYQNELSVSGSWTDMDEPGDTETTNLQLRYGRFVSPQLVGTGSIDRTRFEAPGTDSAWTTFLIGAKYYINPVPKSGLVPFLGAAVGIATTDVNGDDSTDLAWEIGGGAAYFLSERTSLDAGLQFFRTDTDIETEGTRFFVGLTTRF